jgi:hypothetical protein
MSALSVRARFLAMLRWLPVATSERGLRLLALFASDLSLLCRILEPFSQQKVP